MYRNLLMRTMKKLKRTLTPWPYREVDLDGLIKLGLKVGKHCNIQHGVSIDRSHCWHIEIGNNVTVAPRAIILAHDASTKKHLGYTRIGKVIIEDNVFIGAGTIVLPNVRIGMNSVIGAGSLVNKDIPDNSVAAGNPARVISSLESFLDKHTRQMKLSPCFGEEYTLRKHVTDEMKGRMNELMVDRQGYIV